MPLGVNRPQWVNSLWPSDAMWQQRTGSTLAQVMACCLTAPSHYLNQCSFTIFKVNWYSFEYNFTGDTPAINHWISWKITFLKFLWNLPGANEFMWTYLDAQFKLFRLLLQKWHAVFYVTMHWDQLTEHIKYANWLIVLEMIDVYVIDTTWILMGTCNNSDLNQSASYLLHKWHALFHVCAVTFTSHDLLTHWSLGDVAII